MSSDTSGHLSRPMRDFIRRLGYSTSKQEELELIREQVDSFRSDLRNIKEENVLKDLFSRYFSNEIGQAGIYEHLLRLLYAHMLGLDVALGCIFAINATQDKSIRLKKLAYMVATRLVVDRPELRILLVASFQRDLTCKYIHDLVIVLGAIEKVLDAVILDACLAHILPLLTHENDLVRKKAYLIVYRTRRIMPDRLEDYSRLVLAALDDPEFSVKTIGTIMIEHELRTGQMLEESVERICKLADQLMVRNAYSKYSYHKMPNPWVQLRLLRCVALLGSVGPPADLFEVVVLSGKKADRYAAGAMEHAVVVECCRTVSQLPENNYIVEILGQQLQSLFSKGNHNYLSHGIQGLKHLTRINPEVLTEAHQLAVLDCLQSEDVTIRLAATSFMAAICNNHNLALVIQIVIGQMQATADSRVLTSLLKKCLWLLQKHSPSPIYYVQQINKVIPVVRDLFDHSLVKDFLAIIQDNVQAEYDDFAPFVAEEMLGQLGNECTEMRGVAACALYELSLAAPAAFGQVSDRVVEQVTHNFSRFEDRGPAIMLLSRAGVDPRQLADPTDFLQVMECHEFMASTGSLQGEPDLAFIKKQAKPKRTTTKIVTHEILIPPKQ